MKTANPKIGCFALLLLARPERFERRPLGFVEKFLPFFYGIL